MEKTGYTPLGGTGKAGYKRITSYEAAEMMAAGGGIVVLDVRTQEEYSAGHIKGALLLPDYEIGDNAEAMLPNKSVPILVYCRTGRRSEAAAKGLVAMGYTAVYDFGGIVGWTGGIVQ